MPNVILNGGPTLEDFAAEIIVAKDLIGENRKALGRYQHELVLQAEEVVQKAMIDALSDAQAEELARRVGEGMSDEEIEKFFENSGADYESAIRKTLAEFREEKMAEDLVATFAETVPAQGASETAAAVAAGIAAENKKREHDDLGGMNNSNNTGAMPTQGTVSEIQGTSDVEGKVMTNITAVTPAQGARSEVQGASDVEGRTLTQMGSTLVNQQATTTHDVHKGMSGSVQGTTSEAQGASDVEGRALAKPMNNAPVQGTTSDIRGASDIEGNALAGSNVVKGA